MRNSEPDSKHFVESLDFLSIPCQNPQKPPQNCTIDLLCGFLRNWWLMISLLCGHKIELCSYCCHFMNIESQKELFKPRFAMVQDFVSCIRDLRGSLTAGARGVRTLTRNCMKCDKSLVFLLTHLNAIICGAVYEKTFLTYISICRSISRIILLY